MQITTIDNKKMIIFILFIVFFPADPRNKPTQSKMLYTVAPLFAPFILFSYSFVSALFILSLFPFGKATSAQQSPLGIITFLLIVSSLRLRSPYSRCM